MSFPCLQDSLGDKIYKNFVDNQFNDEDPKSYLQESLGDKIYKNFVNSQFNDEDPKSYLPEGCIDKLVTRASIGEALSQGLVSMPLREREELVQFIERKAKKVFAITMIVIMDGKKLCLAMKDFMRYDFGDDSKHLPLSQEARKDNWPRPLAFRNKELWNRLRLFKFHDEQWKFFVPIFSKAKFHYDLEWRHILPFQSVKGSQPKTGSFGKVFEVEIHEAHQKDPIYLVNTRAHIS